MDFRKNIEGPICPGQVIPNAPLILLREPHTENADKFWLAEALLKENKDLDEKLYCGYLQKVVYKLLGRDLAECYFMNLRPECGEGSASAYYNKTVLPELKKYCRQKDAPVVAERMQIIETYVSQGKIGAILTVSGIYELLREKSAEEHRKQEGSLNYRKSTTVLFSKRIDLYRIYHPAYYRRNQKVISLLEKEWEKYV